MQVPNARYKPPTVIGDTERHCREPFVAHARAMTERFGSVTCVNLVNRLGSEGRLCSVFEALVEGARGSLPINIISFDFHKECGKMNYGCDAPMLSVPRRRLPLSVGNTKGSIPHSTCFPCYVQTLASWMHVLLLVPW